MSFNDKDEKLYPCKSELLKEGALETEGPAAQNTLQSSQDNTGTQDNTGSTSFTGAQAGVKPGFLFRMPLQCSKHVGVAAVQSGASEVS